MKLVFLGTGGSHPTINRNVSALALKYQGDVYLFDCGEGTQRQLMGSSLSFMKIKKIFITHFHGDHFLGLAGLIQSMNLNDRKEPLEIYGPVGPTKEAVRTMATVGHFRPGFPIKIRELYPGAVLRWDDVSIKAVKPNHNVPSLAYSFKEKDRKGRFDKPKALELGVPEGPLFSRLHEGKTVEVNGEKIRSSQVVGPLRQGKKVVYSGDTKPSTALREEARNADVLVHEATFGPELSERASEHGHSSMEEVAELAKSCGVGKLFLVHISPRYHPGEEEELEKKARTIFEDSSIPSDLEEYEF